MRLRLSIAAFLTVLSFALPAQAKSAFFIQVGTASSESDADSRWKELQEKYPAVLGGLQFSPRVVTPVGGGDSEVRIQGGPAATRDQAQRLCSRLQAQDIDCFVVETAVFEGEPSIPKNTVTTAKIEKEAPKEDAEPKPVELASAPPSEEPAPSVPAEAAPAEPAAAPAPVIPVQQEAQEMPQPPPPPAPEPEVAKAPEPLKVVDSGPLPWLSDLPPAPPGRVEVAEAIPVMPGEDITPQAPVVAAVTETPPAPEPAAAPVPHSEWVQVQGFRNEQAAYDFSQALHSEIGDRSLRMKVNRSLFGRTNPRSTSLTVGPVADSATAGRICSFAASYDAALSCGGDAGDAAPVVAQAAQPVISQPYTYPTRMSASAPAPAPDARRAFAGNPPSRFWAQLGSWRNQAEALRRWETLSAAHKAVLKDLQPNISAPTRVSVYAKPSVRLRLGPYPEREEAERLCDKLSNRGVSCLVVPE